MNEIENKKKWEILHSQGRFRPKYLHELVVQFLFHNFKRDGQERVLDLGCGAGRNVVLMGNENVIPYGLDVSSEGVAYTKELLEKYHMGNFTKNIVCNSFSNIPYDDNFFDGVIAFASLYYGDSQTIQAVFSEIYRVCAPGGVYFCGLEVATIIDLGQVKR